MAAVAGSAPKPSQIFNLAQSLDLLNSVEFCLGISPSNKPFAEVGVRLLARRTGSSTRNFT